MRKRTEELFGVSDVLGLQAHRASLVLDGKLYRLVRCSHNQTKGDVARLFGVWRQVELVGEVTLLQDKYMMM